MGTAGSTLAGRSINFCTPLNNHHLHRSTQLINFPLHCNACETFLLTATGQCCSVCGAASCASVKCIRTVDRKTPCKAMSRAKSFEEAQNKSKSPSKHKWLVGNLPLESLCCVCDEPAGDGPGLRDLRCVCVCVCVCVMK